MKRNKNRVNATSEIVIEIKQAVTYFENINSNEQSH